MRTTQFGIFFLHWYLLCGMAVAEVDVPPGYRVVELTNNSHYNYRNAMNNRGDVVWTTRFTMFGTETEEIFLYSDGQITQITDNDRRDDQPDINDDGTLVWTTNDSLSGRMEIVMLRNGELTYLTDERLQPIPSDNWQPRINNRGHVAWARFSEFQCATADAEVWYFDGEKTFQLTDIGLSNQAVALNNNDSVAWTRYNFCPTPWEAQIMLQAGDSVTAISEGQLEPQYTGIADNNEVVWQFYVPGAEDKTVVKYKSGKLQIVSDLGNGPAISDNGEYIVFNRWFADLSTYEVFVHSSDVTTQLLLRPLNCERSNPTEKR